MKQVTITAADVQGTRKELQAINPDVIVPMLRTGERLIETLGRNMPDRVVYSNVGIRYTFGA